VIAGKDNRGRRGLAGISVGPMSRVIVVTVVDDSRVLFLVFNTLRKHEKPNL